MPSQITLPHVHFNTYHHSNSLLIQFIINEYLQAYREVKAIHRQAAALKPDNSRSRVKRPAADYHAITQSIIMLSGSTQHYMRLFSWNADAGILGKLKNYCAFFSHNTDYEDKTLLAMHRHADKAWILCMQSMDIIGAMHEAAPKASAAHQEELYTILEKINACMRNFARLISEVCLQFSDDENVVFFILRHHEQLDAVIGPGYVSKLLRKMYPKGIQEAARFLIKRYTGRGFANLLPAISSKISELSPVQT